jgi:dihydrofolate reductase/thymidylate synthase
MFSSIVAIDSKNGIGKNGSIPWNIPEDLSNFRRVTMGGIVIMGRKTYESIGKPLPGRTNCVISNTMDKTKGVEIFRCPWDCVLWCQENRVILNSESKKITREVFVCGGANIYKWFDDNNLISNTHVTYVKGDFDCDVHYILPLFTYQVTYENHFRGRMFESKTIDTVCKHTCHCCYEIGAIYYVHHYDNKEEQQILDLMKEIVSLNVKRGDRTGTGTLSIFGRQMKFSLRNNQLPLMTTRPVYVRGLFEELMMYIRGQTDSKILEDKGVNIWKGNTSREFLDSRGLEKLETGDMGHTYGFSFRHFGAEYKGCNVDYTGQGFDQVMTLIDGLKNDPNGRRHIISLWEPQHFHNASLPPCLYQYQFYVANGELSCMMTQRSSDIALALGWNIAAGSILTIILAYYCNMKPGELTWNGGDIHIYNNLINQANINISRVPVVYPKIFLRHMPTDITLVEFDNLEIVNYNPQSRIKMRMNV